MTTILWDIDGVLSPYLATDLRDRGFTHVQHGWATWDIDLRDHKKWLQTLHDKARMVWVSSWEDDSNALCGYYDIPPLDYIRFSYNERSETSPDTWKLPTVQQWLSTLPDDELVIWVDDQIEQDALDFARVRGNMEIVVCDPEVGLTHEQYQRILSLV